MKFIYNLGIRCYGLAIVLAALFNEKAKKWRAGRKDIFSILQKTFTEVKEPIAWFHCSSLGEFEQGRPVIEAFRKQKPDYKIVLTFFSPSGYEVRKNYNGADFVFYLPLDTPSNAKRFVQIVKPKFSVFVKYEFWFNYLQELHKTNTPVYLISAKFRPDQYFFKGYASWFRKQLKEYKKIFVQDAASENLLKKVEITNMQVAGDTRFDRVIANARQAQPDELVKAFKGNHKLWVCGSTWPDDEKLILQTLEQVKETGVKLLLVPHETGESNIARIASMFPNSARYTTANYDEVNSFDTLIVDKIGLLSSLYQYGDLAYVGGGFGKGIHNLLEAAVYGIPVLFGPTHHKFNEATELINCKGGAEISSAEELLKRVSHLLKDDVFCKQCGGFAKNYVFSSKGATEKILAELGGF